MSLLLTLMQDPLDPEYRRAAARRQAAGRSQRRASTRALLFLGLLCIGVFTSVAVAQARDQPITSDQRERLVAQIEERTRRTDELKKRVLRLRQEVGQIRTQRLAKSDRGQQARARLRDLQMAAAVRPVRGTGLVVTVDDAPPDQDSISGDKPEYSRRVQDRDLRILVNALWAAGAEEISVDGQRLTSLTAIRSAGEAILANYRPLNPPYVVKAIGAPDRLRSELADSDAGRYFHTLQANIGISFRMETREGLRLPGASGVSLRYAREANQE